MKPSEHTHFLPHFGSRAIADLATDEGEVALLDWLIALREHPSHRDGTPIALHTVRNVASCVRVFLADGAERKIVRRNPSSWVGRPTATCHPSRTRSATGA